MTSRAYRVALWAAAAAGAVVAVSMALSLRGTFEHRALALATALAGAVVLLLALMLHALSRRTGRPWIRSASCVAAVLGILGVSQVESWVVGRVIHDQDVRAARAHAELIVARLEHLRATSGSYPTTLEEAVRELAEPPYLWRRSGVFNSSGGEFVLSFSEADAVLPHVVQYSSASSRWERF